MGRSNRMTVGQLIDLLTEQDRDLPVVVRGYEEGWHDVGSLRRTDLERDRYDEWYFGPHAEPYSSSDEVEPHLVIEGLT